MKQQILTLFPWPWLPTVALMIFFVFFVVLVVSLFMKSRSGILASAENLPLQDGEKL